MKTTKKTIQAVLLAVAMAGTAGPACAQGADDTRGWYGGINLGRGIAAMGGSEIDGALARQGLTSTTTLSRHETAYSILLGYQFNPAFALEGGYTRVGSYKFNSGVTAPAAGTVNGSWGVHGLSLAAVGTMPLREKWSAFGKAGLLYSRVTLNAGASSGAITAAETHQTNGSLFLGAGFGYDFTRKFGARLEWNRYFGVGDASTGRGDVDVFSVGLIYRWF